MATTSLPDSIKKRDLLFGVIPASKDQLSNYGKAFEEVGQLYDAIEFYARAQNQDALKKVQALAVKEGDTFIFLHATKYMSNLDTEQLRLCSQNAEVQMKFRYALKGYEKLEDAEGLSRINLAIQNDADIVAEKATKVFIPTNEEEA